MVFCCRFTQLNYISADPEIKTLNSQSKQNYVLRFRDSVFLFFLLQFSLKTAGVYKATISDDRGKDMSQIDISGKGKLSLNLYSCLI